MMKTYRQLWELRREKADETYGWWRDIMRVYEFVKEWSDRCDSAAAYMKLQKCVSQRLGGRGKWK
jgi:hypothetical protein